MLELVRPFKRRGWAVFRMLIVASYLARYGTEAGVFALQHLGVQHLPDPRKLPGIVEFPILTIAMVLADFVLRFLHSLQVKKLLLRSDLPTFLHPMEMMWSKRICEEVWRPSYFDEQALYVEQPAKSSRRIQNFLFLVRVLLLIVETSRMGIVRVFRSLSVWKWHL